MGFKPSQAEIKSRKVSGYRGVNVWDIRNPVDKRSCKSVVKTLIQIRTVHLLGQVAGIKNHRHIKSLETKSLRPFESENNESIKIVDPRKDTCCVIMKIRDLVIRTHISECFGFGVDKV
jgi:hypothetical protein